MRMRKCVFMDMDIVTSRAGADWGIMAFEVIHFYVLIWVN